MTKVAVITRTKDRVLFLRRAIESVSNQTYRDFVHVIVNDGGDETSVNSVVESFPDEVVSKIKLFHRPAASNAPDTIFNESIDRVDSEYVAIHDDDDTWDKNFLAKTIEVLEGGAKGVVARIDNQYETVQGDTIVLGKTSRYMPNMRSISLYDQCLDNQLTAGAFVYSRSAYKEVGKYDETLPVIADWEFGIRFLLKYDVEYIDPGYPLAYYHRRSSAADNSFAAHDHRKYLTEVLNRYLRNDIDAGGLGIGYIMNSRWSERDNRHKFVKNIAPKKILNAVRKMRS